MSEVLAPRPPSWGDLPRWVWPVLVCSLAVNLLVAGTMLGDRARAWQGRAKPASAQQDGQSTTPSLAEKLTLKELVERTKQYTEGHHPVEKFQPADLANELVVH